MKGFPEFIITNIDEVEIEILMGFIKENNLEFMRAVKELISIKKSHKD